MLAYQHNYTAVAITIKFMFEYKTMISKLRYITNFMCFRNTDDDVEELFPEATKLLRSAKTRR